MGSENRKQKQVVPYVLKRIRGSDFSCSVPQPAGTAKET